MIDIAKVFTFEENTEIPKDLLADWSSFSTDVTPVKATPKTNLKFSHVPLPRLMFQQPTLMSEY